LNEKTRKEAVEWLLKRKNLDDVHHVNVLDGIELILRILLEKENL